MPNFLNVVSNVLFLLRPGASLTRNAFTRLPERWPYLILFLGAAKLAEFWDLEIYALGQVISGHTVKHLLAALAVYWILRMLQQRDAKTPVLV